MNGERLRWWASVGLVVLFFVGVITGRADQVLKDVSVPTTVVQSEQPTAPAVTP